MYSLSHNTTRRILLILFLVALLSLALAINVFFRKVEISMPSFFRPALESRLLMSMEGFRFDQLAEHSTPCIVQARRADLYESREARMHDIDILLNTDGKQNVSLIGDEGTLNMANGNALVRKGEREVRVVTSDGYLLTTSSIRWESAERIVKTNDTFKLLGNDIYLEGKGFSADTALHAMSVNGDVKAVLQE